MGVWEMDELFSRIVFRWIKVTLVHHVSQIFQRPSGDGQRRAKF